MTLTAPAAACAFCTAPVREVTLPGGRVVVVDAAPRWHGRPWRRVLVAATLDGAGRAVHPGQALEGAERLFVPHDCPDGAGVVANAPRACA
jgi:hypothetical protein